VRLAILLVLAACDLQPPPKREQPVAPGDASAAADAVTAVPPGPPPDLVDAGVAKLPPDAMVDPTQECLDIGVHLAQLEIDHMKDPVGKAQLEQERASTVRKVSQACSSRQWNVEVRACYLKAKTRPETAPCARLLNAGG
jgi:hypothetical protein